LDGTEIAANASGQANCTATQLRAEVDKILAEVKENHRSEDALYGAARGDELPAELADRRSRKSGILLAKAASDQEEARRDEEFLQRLADKAAAEDTRTHQRSRSTAEAPSQPEDLKTA
jgi:hypothetical protein